MLPTHLKKVKRRKV